MKTLSILNFLLNYYSRMITEYFLNESITTRILLSNKDTGPLSKRVVNCIREIFNSKKTLLQRVFSTDTDLLPFYLAYLKCFYFNVIYKVDENIQVLGCFIILRDHVIVVQQHQQHFGAMAKMVFCPLSSDCEPRSVLKSYSKC